VISLHLKTLFDGIVALEFKDENITKMFKVYSDDTRKDWVLQQPGQVVASVA